jgi:Xaa-Pro dipeptidase
MNKTRYDRLVAEARSAGIDCVLLVPGKNLYYLTGLNMGLSERPAICAIPTGHELFFIMPGFEAERVRSATGIDRIYGYADDEGPGPAIRSSKLFQHGKRFAVEYRSMRVLEQELVKSEIPGSEFTDVDLVLAGLRSLKDPEEIRCLENAGLIVDQAAAAGIRFVRAGRTEREVADVVQGIIKGAGVTGDQMVASGPRSAVPHAHTTGRVIEEGDAVWIDIVLFFEGYVADITRSCFAGKPSDEMRKVYETVYRAQEKCRTMARPGMTGAEIDALCRNHIEQCGYGANFTHRTGHGIGLEIHEEPYIVKSNKVPLAANMAFTIEPGIYLPGKGGIRIEDDVILTERGSRFLTNCPREFAWPE